MTTVNTIEDLVRILDEHPDWLESFRARLLTRELLGLPHSVAELDERMARIEENQAELARSQAALTSSHAQLAEALARLEARQDRMQDDLGWIKGRIIYDIVRNDAGQIAREMGFALEKTLVRADLMELTKGQDVSDLPRGTLRSFRRADLVMQVADGEGNLHYIAVEASFTVNGRDSRARAAQRRIDDPVHRPAGNGGGGRRPIRLEFERVGRIGAAVLVRDSVGGFGGGVGRHHGRMPVGLMGHPAHIAPRLPGMHS